MAGLNTIKLNVVKVAFLAFVSIFSTLAAAADGNYLVLGVIASNKDHQGVVLFKDVQTSRTFAAREGKNFSPNSMVLSVGRKAVTVVINGKNYTIEVGGDTLTALAGSSNRSSAVESVSLSDGMEKNGDTIVLSQAMKEHLIKNDLSKILMQAAAVPQMVDGRLVGFQLWEIEPKSVFDAAGLKNGDLVTSINGYEINDIGATIKQLTALKGANEAAFEYSRQF